MNRCRRPRDDPHDRLPPGGAAGAPGGAGPARSPASLVVFGAFDRHNLGDLLFAHLAQALQPGEAPIFAGLASRDLRPLGGHRVHALAEVAAEVGERPVRVLQLGGELLTCTAWQAAVMLLPPGQVQPTLAWLARRPSTRRRWVRDALGRDDRAPYLLARGALPHVDHLVVAGVGGVDLARCAPAMRAEVVAKLRAADARSVRDRVTQRALHDAGVECALVPDPAVLVAQAFGARIAAHMRAGDVQRATAAFAGGYVALQASAAFGDDATLDVLAAQLRAVQAATGLGVVLWRAGAAPWHDDLGVLQRLAARLPTAGVRVFESLHLWQTCAIVAGARAVCASSLHARIVALAFGLPRVSLRPPGEPGQRRKLAAWIATWDADTGGPVNVPHTAKALLAALATPSAALRQAASQAIVAWQAYWPAHGPWHGPPQR
ncbi:polysaccharide pyruvyl transferase family protein [Azohydromonas sediminis]|uniref:polysaccharide pyruvyl transferase family protein n=1 Tax=Azohydromonas sediminis TaxID=2259674 RepID=UPI001B356DE6|nr:polysaccharide pyruvyl transferase family protein [Azohydromonas sediminis]